MFSLRFRYSLIILYTRTGSSSCDNDLGRRYTFLHSLHMVRTWPSLHICTFWLVGRSKQHNWDIELHQLLMTKT